MPDPSEYDDKDKFMEVCIPKVLEDGTAKDNDQAVAICASMWEKKSIKAVTKKEGDGDHPASHYLVVEDPESPSTWHLRVKNAEGIVDHNLLGAAWAALHEGFRGNKYEGPDKEAAIAKLRKLYAAEEMEPPGGKSITDGSEKGQEEVKVGARHSQRDQRALQDIHDAAITLGASCPPPPTDSHQTSFPLETAFALEKSVVYFGGEVKALGDGKVGGYLVTFGSDANPDLTGDYFTKDTDFSEASQSDVYYQHGMDRKVGKRRLAKGDLRIDDVGVWIEAQLQMRDEYERAIYELAAGGKLGWSSGTAPHLVEREQVGKAMHIKAWPLGLDASLTPTPAEPRNTAIPIKSLYELPGAEEAEAEAAGDAAPIPDSLEQQTEDEGFELSSEQVAEFVVDLVNAFNQIKSKFEKPR